MTILYIPGFRVLACFALLGLCHMYVCFSVVHEYEQEESFPSECPQLLPEQEVALGLEATGVLCR